MPSRCGSRTSLSSRRYFTRKTSSRAELVTLPAGEMRGAFGISTRRNSVAFDPDAINDDRIRARWTASACSRDLEHRRRHFAYARRNAELLVPIVKAGPLSGI